MRAQISVIVPTLNAEKALAKCLGALMEGLEHGLIRELIISDGGSEDATCAVAQAWGAEVLEGDASRGGQLRRGVALAKGDWLLVLHADTVLCEGWSEAVQAHLADPEFAGWFRLAFDQGGWPRILWRHGQICAAVSACHMATRGFWCTVTFMRRSVVILTNRSWRM